MKRTHFHKNKSLLPCPEQARLDSAGHKGWLWAGLGWASR